MLQSKHRVGFTGFNRFLVVAITLVFLVALSVMFGWIFEHPGLIQIRPSFAPMQFNTALLFVISSIGILAGLFDFRRTAFVAGSFVTFFAFLTGLQYLVGGSFWIDELFIQSEYLVETSHPGRMAPNTALCFTLSGLSVFMLVLFRRSAVLPILGTLICSLSIIALFGYLSQTVAAYGWGEMTRMALHTATGFLIFGSVLVAVGWQKSIRKDVSRSFPEWFPFFCGMLALTAGLCAWNVVSELEKNRAEVESGWAAQVFRMVFHAKASSETFAIYRNAKRWQAGFRGKEWEPDARRLLRGVNGLKAIFVTKNDDVIESVFAEGAADDGSFRDPEILKDAMAMHRAGHIKWSFVGAVPESLCKDGHRGFLIASPINFENTGDIGLLIAYADVKEFFANRSAALEKIFDYRIFDSDDTVLAGPPLREGNADNASVLLSFVVRGSDWKIQAIPKNGGLTPSTGFRLSVLVLIFMVLFALMVTAIAALAQRYYRLQGERSDEEIRIANEEMETMLFIIAHDLREPLRTVMSFSSITMKEYGEKLGEDGKGMLERVVAGGRKIEKVLGGVTDVAKSERVELSVEPVDLGVLVNEELLEFSDRIVDSNMKVQVATNLPSLRVDEMLVRQLVSNLLGNAFKFSTGDSPSIFVSKYEGPEGTGIVVKDTGVGIPEHMEDKIFDLFRRGVTPETPGAGVGLAIVKRVARRHGGDAWAKNRKGGGAEFYVTLSSGKA